MTLWRDWLWDLWEDTKHRWRVCASWLGGWRRPFVELHPASILFSLTIVAAAHRGADRLPCELTLNESNILDFAGEWSDDPKLTHVRRDARKAWRMFCRRLKQAGGRVDALTCGPLARIKVLGSGDASGVRLSLSASTEEFTPLDKLLPKRR